MRRRKRPLRRLVLVAPFVALALGVVTTRAFESGRSGKPDGVVEAIGGAEVVPVYDESELAPIDVVGVNEVPGVIAVGQTIEPVTEIPVPPPAAKPAHTPVLRRVCRVTAYSDRGTTASGVEAGVGQCAAPSYVPFGARVHVPELGRTFIVTDRTHKRFRNSTIDIFMPSTSRCKSFGRKYLDCEIHVDPPSARKATLKRL